MRRLHVLLTTALAATALALPAVAGGCHRWDPKAGSLHDAVAAHPCVEVPKGVHLLSQSLTVPGGHVLRGDPSADREQVVLKATRVGEWYETAGMLKSGAPWDQPTVVVGLTIDGSSRRDHRFQGSSAPDGAWVGVTAPSMVLHDVVVRNNRCVGISSYEDLMLANLFTTVVTNSLIEGNGFACSTKAAPPGAGVYLHPVGGGTDRVVFSGNVVRGNDGSAFDIDRVDGGVLTGNTIEGNSVVDGFAAISLVDASEWLISGNTVTHPSRRGKKNCPGWPAGEGSAALFVCARLGTVAGNVIVGNSFKGHYSVLVNRFKGNAIGNVIRDNEVTGTGPVRCAEGNPRDANTWAGNNCGSASRPTVADEPPVYFKGGR